LISEVARGSKAEILTCLNYAEALKLMASRPENEDFVLIKGANKESIDHLIEAIDQSIPTTNVSSICQLSKIISPQYDGVLKQGPASWRL